MAREQSFVQLFWLAATFALVGAGLPHPPAISSYPNDKLQHVGAVASLALLGSFAYRATAPVILLLQLSFFGGLIKVVKASPRLHRDSEVFN